MNRFEKITLTLDDMTAWINDNVINCCSMCMSKGRCVNGGTRDECIEGIEQWLKEDIEEN